jgi:hypothetical protein
MRWWLNTDHGQFSVDNASVADMDFSTLPADVWMVHWIDGKGELERQVDATTNDNGLREPFIDVVPYAPFFQQFLTKLPMLTLVQAKKVQIDLIKQIFESKRQAPYHYPVASGDYSWDASDEALFSSTGAQLQSTLALSSTVAELINRDVSLAADGDALVTFVNNKIVGPGTDTLSTNLKRNWLPDDPSQLGTTYASPGLANNIAHTAVSFALPALTLVSTTMQWIPIGGATPVAVTPAEQTAILNGIAARTNTLAGKKNTKIAQVNALTTISAVIAYDVTTGW